jgi:hypothetical protein
VAECCEGTDKRRFGAERAAGAEDKNTHG